MAAFLNKLRNEKSRRFGHTLISSAVVRVGVNSTIYRSVDYRRSAIHQPERGQFAVILMFSLMSYRFIVKM